MNSNNTHILYNPLPPKAINEIKYGNIKSSLNTKIE